MKVVTANGSMMRKLIWLTVFVVGASLVFIGIKRYVLPRYIATIIISDETPQFLPKRLEKKLKTSRKQVNASVDTVLRVMHQKGVTLNQILKAIDDAEEDQVYAFLDELNAGPVLNNDQVFTMAKKYFKTEFDPEIFRPVFHQHVSVDMIKTGLAYANKQREDPEISPETARAILKQLLVEKEKKYQVLQNVNSR